MEFLNALSVQGRVISALTLRETRSRYGNRKLGFFWALFEPFAHVIVFVGIFSALGRASPIGDNIGIFLLTGIMPWLLYNNLVSAIMNAHGSNVALLGYPQVMPMDIIISRVFLEFSSITLVFLLFIGIAYFTGTKIIIDNFLQLISAVVLLVIFSIGIGLINAAIISTTPSYSNIYSAFSRPMYFMSGIFFTADFLSPSVYKYLSYNPLLNMMEWFRSGFFTSFNSDLYDTEYTLSVTFIIFFIGLIAERLTSRKARQVS